MEGRWSYQRLKRLRLIAGEAPLTPESVGSMMQPFIDAWRKPSVPNRGAAEQKMSHEFTLSNPALVDLAARIRAIGMTLNKSGQKGIDYHNAFARHLAALAATFDCQGFTESSTMFDDPDGNAAPGESPTKLAGRVDVVWSRRGTVVAVFEIDSTVKPRSFQKLKEAATPHRLWVYFGKDIWGFRMFLQKEDPAKEITPILIPRTFIPTFDES